MIVDVVIPVLNEELSLGPVLDAIPKNLVRRVLVVDNGSNDDSSNVAISHGASVVNEPRRGYGRAIWSGVEYLSSNPPEVVVFIAGDGSDDPKEIPSLLAPIEQGLCGIVVGSRTTGTTEMPVAQRIGNILVPNLLRLLYGTNTTDLGSSRALRWDALLDLNLVDRGYGITVEMQIKAAKKNLKIVEVPVTHHARTAGDQKISGNPKQSVKAGLKILWTTARYLLPF